MFSSTFVVLMSLLAFLHVAQFAELKRQGQKYLLTVSIVIRTTCLYYCLAGGPGVDFTKIVRSLGLLLGLCMSYLKLVIGRQRLVVNT